jgi:soluble lytic murein transglycosylase-like protein
MSALHKLMYQRILFCHKCHRSMFVGLNRRYFSHLLKHTAINKILILLAVLGLISLYPSTISIMSAKKIGLGSYISEAEFKQERIVQGILKRFVNASASEAGKLSKIIVRHSLAKKLDPKLVAAIIVVESSGNPLAISGSKSVGLMQIHLPTWSNVVNFAEKNPFDPEVNIEIGTGILANYLKRNKDVESALLAYEGSHAIAESEYSAKVMEVYRTQVTP